MAKGKIRPNLLIQFTTLVIYLVFTCSIVYNHSYFFALNISLAQIPLAISDIVNSALIWTPFVSIIAVVGFLFLLITKRIEQGMTEEEIIQSTSNPARTTFYRELPFRVMEYASIVAVIFFIIFGQLFYKSLTSIFIMFMVFWFWFGGKLSDHPRIMQRRSLWLKLIIIFAPVIVGFIFVRGYDDAINAISISKSNSIIYLKNGAPFPAVTLRNLEKGILLRKLDSDAIEFIPWEGIATIDTQFEKNYYSGLICWWTKWCPKVSTNHPVQNSVPVQSSG